MKKMILIISILVVVILLVLPLSLGVYRTWLVAHSNNQKVFSNGKIPSPLPNGLYKGTINLKTTWEGKKFDSSASTGINIVNQKELYPFKTYIGKGLQDTKLDVLKIDYDIQSNPFWLRFILDEIVEVSKNKYLGKVHIRLIPGLPFTLGYFELEK